MNTEILNDEFIGAFLSGDKQAIMAMGDEFLKSNGKDPILTEQVENFIGGWQPQYLNGVGEGWGMSTTDAIRCLFDLERTSLFIKAISNTTKNLKQKFLNEKLVSIEAGCGTGILAVAMVLSGIDQVIALDINPETVKWTKNFVNWLGLEEKVEVIEQDATIYQPKNNFHLFVSENMHTGLYFEPQVQIINQLEKYLKKGGAIIPESIQVQWALGKTDWDKIGKTHAELATVKSLVEQTSEWSQPFQVNFDGSTPEQIEANAVFVPFAQAMLGVASNNAMFTQMTVQIDAENLLFPNAAKFLGTDHVHQIKPSILADDMQKKLTFSYLAGGNPPDTLTLSQ